MDLQYFRDKRAPHVCLLDKEGYLILQQRQSVLIALLLVFFCHLEAIIVLAAETFELCLFSAHDGVGCSHHESNEMSGRVLCIMESARQPRHVTVFTPLFL